MNKKIVIIDYNTGNVSAISNMLYRIGEKPIISNKYKVIDDADIIILPGVGSYDRAINKLKEKDLNNILKKKIKEKTKILGICLGMQILCNGSEEGKEDGLKVFDVTCKSFDFKDTSNIFMGWSDIKVVRDINDFKFLNKSKFYFLHRYFFPIHKDYSIAFTKNNIEFSSCVRKDNIFGVQFHPEKSHNFGINFFKNFINLR